eukprot:284815974_5
MPFYVSILLGILCNAPARTYAYVRLKQRTPALHDGKASRQRSRHLELETIESPSAALLTHFAFDPPPIAEAISRNLVVHLHADQHPPTLMFQTQKATVLVEQSMVNIRAAFYSRNLPLLDTCSKAELLARLINSGSINIVYLFCSSICESDWRPSTTSYVELAHLLDGHLESPIAIAFGCCHSNVFSCLSQSLASKLPGCELRLHQEDPRFSMPKARPKRRRAISKIYCCGADLDYYARVLQLSRLGGLAPAHTNRLRKLSSD